MSATTKVDISNGITTLCNDLGFDPNDVSRIVLDVTDGIVITSLKRLNGKHYTVNQHGEPCKGRYKTTAPDEICYPAKQTTYIAPDAITWHVGEGRR